MKQQIHKDDAKNKTIAAIISGAHGDLIITFTDDSFLYLTVHKNHDGDVSVCCNDNFLLFESEDETLIKAGFVTGDELEQARAQYLHDYRQHRLSIKRKQFERLKKELGYSDRYVAEGKLQDAEQG